MSASTHSHKLILADFLPSKLHMATPRARTTRISSSPSGKAGRRIIRRHLLAEDIPHISSILTFPDYHHNHLHPRSSANFPPLPIRATGASTFNIPAMPRDTISPSAKPQSQLSSHSPNSSRIPSQPPPSLEATRRPATTPARPRQPAKILRLSLPRRSRRPPIPHQHPLATAHTLPSPRAPSQPPSTKTSLASARRMTTRLHLKARVRLSIPPRAPTASKDRFRSPIEAHISFTTRTLSQPTPPATSSAHTLRAAIGHDRTQPTSHTVDCRAPDPGPDPAPCPEPGPGNHPGARKEPGRCSAPVPRPGTHDFRASGTKFSSGLGFRGLSGARTRPGSGGWKDQGLCTGSRARKRPGSRAWMDQVSNKISGNQVEKEYEQGCEQNPCPPHHHTTHQGCTTQ